MRLLTDLVRWLPAVSAIIAVFTTCASAAETPREVLVRAILAERAAEQRELIRSLAGTGDEEIAALLIAWRTDRLFVHETDDGGRIPVVAIDEPDAAGARAVMRVDTGEPLRDADGKAVRLVTDDRMRVRHNNALRVAMKAVLDVVDLSSPDEEKRFRAAKSCGQGQDPEKLTPLRQRLEVETSGRVRKALREAIALIQLADPSDDVKLAALRELQGLHTISSRALLERARANAEAAGKPALVDAADDALRAVDGHIALVDFLGTVFRGVSAGSILLVIALGLAITFGLMGVINMAHGEMIAVGAYTTYVVQNVFGAGVTLPFFGLSLAIPGLGLGGAAYHSYFLLAVPLSFLTAAAAGIALERGVIQFLYRRPLESLLATWGVSLILQQLFRLMFGANNVQVSSPAFLSSNWTINDIIFGWNRVFVIGFALAIVAGVWLLLTRTSLGLLIRAVMQNRTMAACMGVRTSRVNMLTFGLGSGLAGLAGAFVSQISNVGPALGQSYIIDSFMVVVVGGVGNLPGTVISAFGIGGIDQVFQQYLPGWAPGLAGVPVIGNFLQNLGQDSAVFGKILVLFVIILFLQWRPAGIFVVRSRSLEA